jgi:hypothetical protein
VRKRKVTLPEFTATTCLIEISGLERGERMLSERTHISARRILVIGNSLSCRFDDVEVMLYEDACVSIARNEVL